MKIRTLLLMTSAAYAVGAMPAHAGIESLIIGIHGFLLSSTAVSAAVAGTLATVIGYGIAGAAVVGAAILGRPEVGGAIKPSDAKSNFETGESSVIEGVGRVRVGGLKAFGNTDGSTRARLLCRLHGPIDAVEAYYLGQREVTVEPNGDVSSPPWARPSGSWANWQDKFGTGAETAWSGLMSLFPAIWTSAHRVRGIAQSQLLFYNPGLSEKKYLSLYQNGAPDSEWICRASKVFDPRDLSQFPNDPLTWKWSENGILILAHVLRRDPAFSWLRFKWDLISHWADQADVLVATKTGTEKRARLWGMWAWESERGETMQQFMDSIGAEIRVTSEGKIYFELVEDAITPEIDFTPEDIYDYTWAAGPEAVERPNICRVKYYSPERNYEMAEINLDGIAWARVEDEITRYGPKYLDLEFPFCPSASQAQRLARRRFALARANGGTMVTNFVGLAAWGLLYAQIEEPDLGDIELVKMQPPRIDDENGSVEIPFVIWPTLTAWNPAVDEADAPDVVPELGYETEMETPNAPSAVLQVTYPNGAKELRVDFSLPAQDYNLVEATFRTYTGGLPDTWQSMTEYPEPDDATFAYASGDYLGVTIDSRVRVFNGDEGSYFSPVLNAVVGVDNSAPTAPSDNLSAGYSPGDGASISGTAWFNVLRGVAIEFERRTRTSGGTWSSYTTLSTTARKPGQTVALSDSYSTSGGLFGVEVMWRIRTLTSDGTAGTEKTFSATIPGE